MGALREKILLLLLGGISFGFAYTPRRQWYILKSVSREWKKIEKRELREEIRKLYQSKLVEKKANADGSYTLLLTEKGKLKTLNYNFDKIKAEKDKWDKKWRLVVFDVPEKLRWGRDTLRDKLKQVGFYELQKSVFIFPYDCQNEVEFIIEFFNLRRYVRFAVLESIDNESHLKQIFKLS